MDLRCFRCIVAYQERSQEEILPATTIYNGEALCIAHVNIMRGHVATFQRYPEADQPSDG